MFDDPDSVQNFSIILEIFNIFELPTCGQGPSPNAAMQDIKTVTNLKKIHEESEWLIVAGWRVFGGLGL